MAEDERTEGEFDEGVDAPAEDESSQEAEREDDGSQEPDFKAALGSALIRNRKLEAIVAAYLPEGVDLDTEIKHVNAESLTVTGGGVEGEVFYRPLRRESKPESRKPTGRSRGKSGASPNTNGAGRQEPVVPGLV